jgi:hypothetical protein
MSSPVSVGHGSESLPSQGANFLNCKVFPLGKLSEYTACLATAPAMVATGQAALSDLPGRITPKGWYPDVDVFGANRNYLCIEV